MPEPTAQLLSASTYVDYDDPSVRALSTTLSEAHPDREAYAQAVFEYLRDAIPHTASTDLDIITSKASEVLKQQTGICHAKANLLAALLRAEGIPTGFGFQHLTLADDASEGYCLHAFAIAFLDDVPVPLDPASGVEFSTSHPHLAFPNRPEYDEYVLPGIWAEPDAATMRVLDSAHSLDEALHGLPDVAAAPPLIADFHLA